MRGRRLWAWAVPDRITVQQLSVNLICWFEKECGKIEGTLQAYCHFTSGSASIVSAPAKSFYDMLFLSLISSEGCSQGLPCHQRSTGDSLPFCGGVAYFKSYSK